jgi:hypothetical protein
MCVSVAAGERQNGSNCLAGQALAPAVRPGGDGGNMRDPWHVANTASIIAPGGHRNRRRDHLAVVEDAHSEGSGPLDRRADALADRQSETGPTLVVSGFPESGECVAVVLRNTLEDCRHWNTV